MTGIIVLIIYALIMVGATILMTNKEGNKERTVESITVLFHRYS